MLDGNDLGLIWSISLCVSTKGAGSELKCLVPASCSGGRRLRKLHMPDMPFSCPQQVRLLAVPDADFLSNFFRLLQQCMPYATAGFNNALFDDPVLLAHAIADDKLSSLLEPQITVQELRSWLVSSRDHTCAIRPGHVVHLTGYGIQLNFALAIRLLPVWSNAKQVIASYRLLGRMPLPALPSNLKMAWSLQASEPVTIFNCTCFAWESVENLFGSAEFAVRCTDPDSTMIVGVKKSDGAQPWPLASQPRAVFLRLQKPFGTHMRASFGRSNDYFLDLPGVRGPCQGRNFEHHFAVQWVGRELRITMNGVLLPILRLRPEVAASLGAHTKLFVRFFSSAADAQASFSVRPFPCTVQSTSCVSCFRCQALSTVGTGTIRPCSHCLEWFCRWHREQVDDREICHSCAAVWTDAVGGSTGDPVVDVQTQASQDSFAARVHEDIQHQLAVQDAQDAVSAQLKSEEIEERAADVELEAQDDSAWAALKRRRLLPGAATSDGDFHELFTGLEQYRAVFQHEPSEVTEELNSIPNFVSRHRARIAREYPGMSDYMIKLMTAAVAVLGLRTVDVFQRENAMMLWIIEGERHMRFHHGDCYILHNSGAFQHYKGSPLDCSRVHSFLLHLEG